jgi:hypothetical protein
MLCLDFRFRPFVSMKMRVYPSTSVYTLLFIDRVSAKKSVMGVCTVVPSREIHHLIVLVLALYSQSPLVLVLVLVLFALYLYYCYLIQLFYRTIIKTSLHCGHPHSTLIQFICSCEC